ncbi:putative ripening-related protein 1 [Tanacetum coccineum]
MKLHAAIIFLVLFFLTITCFTSYVDAKSSGKWKGKNETLGKHVQYLDHSTEAETYTTYRRSLLAMGKTRATMTINSFEKGGDGGGASECDEQYHSNNQRIVALSTKWYDNGHRCLKFINIYYKNRSVRAKVVDECDSNRGCDDDIVDASKAVWVALQVSKSEWGETEITWSDA